MTQPEPEQPDAPTLAAMLDVVEEDLRDARGQAREVRLNWRLDVQRWREREAWYEDRIAKIKAGQPDPADEQPVDPDPKE